MQVHQLSDLPERNPTPLPWDDVKPTLPWGDPDFSKRMLKEHLDTSHDLASRRPAVHLAQVAWVVNTYLEPRKAKNVLDLTCGPGLWSNALARHGYLVRGIDIAPAAIDYARKTSRDEGLPATFTQADIRDIAYGSSYDAVLLLYGQANSFKWEEFVQILLKTNESLKPGGLLIIEFLHPDALARMAGSSWQTRDQGLFGDRPYLHLTESFWNPDDRTGCQRHFVVDLGTTKIKEYGVSYQCYSRDELYKLLPICGFEPLNEYDSLIGEAGLDNPEWHVIVAERVNQYPNKVML
jgi:SAM-dependent methyltransferase